MKKSLVVMLLLSVVALTALAPAALAQGQPAAGGQASGGQASRPTIKDPAEYNAYVNAVQQSDAKAKAAALEAFLQTYPNSVMKTDAMEQLMAAYQTAGDAQKTLDTATRILQSDPNNVRALAVLSYSYRAMASQGGANMQQNLDNLQKYSQQGEDSIQKMTKPEGMSDADFTKFHNELGAIFEGGLGFVALQRKDNATAAKDFTDAVSHESQPNIADLYPLATADLEAKPVNPQGFWFAVKAANLAQGAGQQQILDYAKKKYVRYHGSEQGWTELVTDATNSKDMMPPASFTVAQYVPPSPAEQAADLVKSKQPKDMSFAEWQLVLSSGNQQAADTVWNAIKGKAVALAANLLSGSGSNFQLAGSEDDIEAKKADIDLTLEKAAPARAVPQVGSLMQFQATADHYTPNPFMLYMTDGVLLDKNGKPISTAAPVHHTTKKPQ